ncbi:MAG: hypothetical protein Q7K39_01605 [Candidatus Magasanikbacteria bacterium]|nr:hypothetical protein [Candidatus Magasanikbacteria bacterium]
MRTTNVTNVVAFCHQNYPEAEVPTFERLYDHHKYVGKLVLLSDGTLLVGNVDRHARLVAIYTKHPLLASDPEKCAEEVEVDYRRQGQVVSAGKFRADATVSWGSLGFDIGGLPPREPGLAAAIEAAIAEAIQREPRLVAPRPPPPPPDPPRAPPPRIHTRMKLDDE